jgi:hypothetical protein
LLLCSCQLLEWTQGHKITVVLCVMLRWRSAVISSCWMPLFGTGTDRLYRCAYCIQGFHFTTTHEGWYCASLSSDARTRKAEQLVLNLEETTAHNKLQRAVTQLGYFGVI